MGDGGDPVGRSDGIMATAGVRLTRDGVVYGLAQASTFPASLITAVIFTNHMTPATYGELGVLMMFAGLLAVAYGLISFQGTFIWVFGSSGDDDAGLLDLEPARVAQAGQQRRGMTTGLVLILTVIGAGTTVLMFAARPLAAFLVGTPHLAGLVRWAALSGAAGGWWRFAGHVPRMERKPATFAFLYSLRPVCVIAVSLPLVISGAGARGALMGTTLGTLANIVVIMVVTRRSYAFGFDVSQLKRISVVGFQYVAIIVGLWMAHNLDTFVVSRFMSPHDLGVYRLSTRFGSVPSYFVTAYLFSWATLEHSPLFEAVAETRTRVAVRATLVTYYWIGAVGVIVALAAGANLLVGLASPAYNGAAEIVPLIGLGFATYGLFIVLARACVIPRRQLFYGGSAIGAGVGTVVVGFLLVPAIGTAGAPLAVIISMGLACSVLVFAQRATPDRAPLEWTRMLGALLIGVACWWIAVIVPTSDRTSRLTAALAALTLYPLALVVLRVIPRQHIQPLGTILMRLTPRRATRKQVLDRVGSLPADERLAVITTMRDRGQPAVLAVRLGTDASEACRILCSGLRRVAGLANRGDDPLAANVGDLFGRRRAPAEFEAVMRALWHGGVDPRELHELEEVTRLLRRVRRGQWRRYLAATRSPLLGEHPRLTRSEYAAIADMARLTGAGGAPPLQTQIGWHEMLRGLRKLTGWPIDTRASDVVLADALVRLGREPARAEQLWSAEVDPLELHDLQRALVQLREMSSRRWRRWSEGAAAPAPDGGIVGLATQVEPGISV